MSERKIKSVKVLDGLTERRYTGSEILEIEYDSPTCEKCGGNGIAEESYEHKEYCDCPAGLALRDREISEAAKEVRQRHKEEAKDKPVCTFCENTGMVKFQGVTYTCCCPYGHPTLQERVKRLEEWVAERQAEDDKRRGRTTRSGVSCWVSLPECCRKESKKESKGE